MYLEEIAELLKQNNSKKSLQHVKPRKVENGYNFKSCAKGSISFAELVSCVTRDNPISLVNAVDVFYICVHASLLVKANICSIPIESKCCFTSDNGNVYRAHNIKDFKSYVDWARLVKASSWPKISQYIQQLPRKDKQGKWIREPNGDKKLFDTAVDHEIKVTFPVV